MISDEDKKLAVRFYSGTKQNKVETEKHGRPIYETIEMCEIKFPGDRTRVVVQPAHSVHYGGTPPQHWTYAERFADYYNLYKSDDDQVVGTPLSEFPAMTEGQRQTYRAAGINTVEMIAEMSDRSVRGMGMNAGALKEKAQAFIGLSEGVADITAMQRQIDDLKAKLDTQSEPAPKSGPADEFGPYSEDDIKNMIKDAGGDIPRGNASRETLIKALRKAQEPAAA